MNFTFLMVIYLVMLPIVAIIGRPNVGKSALFNRLVGTRLSIESKFAGTTRDRLYHTLAFHNLPLMLVDTAGLNFGKGDDLEYDIQQQAQLALDEADIILFVVDVNEPLMASDYTIASLLRKKDKTVILVANKADNTVRQNQAVQFYELGFDHVIGVSALHGYGLDELKHLVKKLLIKLGFNARKACTMPHGIKLAFIGKPNVGKSSLVNKLLGKSRMIVSENPGTTRDAVDSTFEFEGDCFVFIDTAGIRRHAKVQTHLESYSLFRSLQALQRCDAAFLIIDATEGVTRQDLRVSHFILEEAKGLIIVVNKSDLLPDRTTSKDLFLKHLQLSFPYIKWAPVVFVSALTGMNTTELLRISKNIVNERQKNIENKKLTICVKKALMKNNASGIKGKTIKVFEASQTGIEPPKFTFTVNNPDFFHASLRRFIERSLREEFGFEGTVIRLIFKSRTALGKSSVK